MAHHRRKKPRMHTRGNLHSMSSWPKWWDVVFNTRPARRKNKAALRRAMREDNEFVAPTVGRKPHQYYW